MPVYQYKNFIPEIGKDCYLAPGTQVIGRVKLGDDVSIWFNTVVRGDVDDVTVGEMTNIQDLSMLHVTNKFPLNIGSRVTVGHKVTLHGCNIGDNCLIGMGALIMDGASIGHHSLVAAGSLITPGKIFPSYSFIKGSPARAERKLTEEERQLFGNHYKSYLINKKTYLRDGIIKKIF
jgi:carbonic anhydrase/acetyltransferase-like protein (isoleucine patch superfamily)